MNEDQRTKLSPANYALEVIREQAEEIGRMRGVQYASAFNQRRDAALALLISAISARAGIACTHNVLDNPEEIEQLASGVQDAIPEPISSIKRRLTAAIVDRDALARGAWMVLKAFRRRFPGLGDDEPDTMEAVTLGARIAAGALALDGSGELEVSRSMMVDRLRLAAHEELDALDPEGFPDDSPVRRLLEFISLGVCTFNVISGDGHPPGSSPGLEFLHLEQLMPAPFVVVRVGSLDVWPYLGASLLELAQAHAHLEIEPTADHIDAEEA